MHRCTPNPRVQYLRSGDALNLDVMNALVSFGKKTGAVERGIATTGDPASAALLWGILQADATIVSQLLEQLGKMMVVVVTMCADFSPTVSEASTEMACLQTREIPDAATAFSFEAAGEVYKQAHDFVYLGGARLNTVPTCQSKATGAYATPGAASKSTPLNCATDRALPST